MKQEVILALKQETKLSEKEISTLLAVPPSEDLGDFAFPCFVLSKKLKKNPSEIAQDLSKKIKSKSFEKVEPNGPYLNFFLDRSELASKVLTKILKEKEKYGSLTNKQKTVIEFPSPNTNKPLHLGHFRNIALGQSVSNILEFSGHNVIQVNLNNDRGVHICKSMVAYDNFGNGDSPKKSKLKSDHFIGKYYVKFSQESKKNKDLEKQAQECLVKWENEDKSTRTLWEKMNDWALSGFDETYKKLGLNFKKVYFESEIYKSGKEIINKALKDKMAKKKKDGAIFMDLEKYGLGEKVLVRSDGTSIYITQDIYLAKKKQEDFKFDSSIYVSAREQDYHFKTLFKILDLLKYPWAKNLKHLSYGMVNLESGRMKSREGNVVDIDDLLESMENLAKENLEKREKISTTEMKKRSRAIALSAIRYYLLKVDRTKDLVFKPEESLQFEGNTGPYLLYTYARSKSILAKSKKKKSIKVKEISDSEKSLISKLSIFPEITKSAYENLAPNLLANYAFELSKDFNEFYHSEKVIGSENESFKLALIESFSLVLKKSLNLLEIDVLEKM